MRIALISDVHGNLAALRAVLERIDEMDVHVIFALGDLVGRGPDPEAVVRTLEQRGVKSLRGNWDEWVAGGSGWDQRPKRRAHVESARRMMKRGTIKRIGHFPETRLLNFEGKFIRLAHGSPRDPVELLLPEMTDDRLEAAIAGEDSEIIAVGHSHHPFVRKIKTQLLINTGTVGYPFDWDPRATFAILDVDETQEPRAMIERVPYRLSRTLDTFDRRVAQGIIEPAIAHRYKLALLGEPHAPMGRIDRSMTGSDALIHLLAPHIRALYVPDATPDVEVLESRRDRTRTLRAALEIARGAIGPRKLRAAIVRAKRALDPKYGAEAMVDDGVRMIALTMRARKKASLSALAVQYCERVVRRTGRGPTRGKERLRRIASAARMLHLAFLDVDFEGAAEIATALAETEAGTAAMHDELRARFHRILERIS